MSKYKSKFAFVAEDVSIAYDRTPVVTDVDLQVEQGVMLAIVGPNGAGKSTLLKAALELMPKASGHTTFFDKKFGDVRQDIAYVPQTDSVNWDFPATVFDVALMGRYVHKGWIKRCNSEDKQIALQSLEIMGMDKYRSRQISELSGGQRQRVFLARALAQRPELFILDEPLAGVDKTTEKLIIKVLKEYQSQGKTIIAVHHDLATIPEYFDHVCLFDEHVKTYGKTSEVFTEENIAKTFGGTPKSSDTKC